MDSAVFDRLAKSLAEVSTRRGALARLAAVALAGGGALPVKESEAGREHRRNQRHRRNHDNRKGKRGDDSDPPRGGAPGVDCRQPGSQGKLCNDPSRQPPRRCCNGECFPYQNCVEAGKSTGVVCGPNGDCRGADRLCCSGWGACEAEEGADCACALAERGEGCSSDWDCSDGICICGVCR